VPTNARKKHWIGTGGPWGTGLLIAGILSAVLGVGYLLSDASDQPAALRHMAPPLVFWACMWIAAGAYAVLKALSPPQQHIDVWPVVGMSCLWSGKFAWFWIVGVFHGEPVDRSWAGAVIFAAFAGLIISWARCVNPPQREQ
jgi:hypothetical protein